MSDFRSCLIFLKICRLLSTISLYFLYLYHQCLPFPQLLHLLLHSFLRVLFCSLQICLWHVSLSITIGLYIIWEKWMLYVLIVGLCTGSVRVWPILPQQIQNLGCAVSLAKYNCPDLTIHHVNFGIFSQVRMTSQRNFMTTFEITTTHWL